MFGEQGTPSAGAAAVGRDGRVGAGVGCASTSPLRGESIGVRVDAFRWVGADLALHDGMDNYIARTKERLVTIKTDHANRADPDGLVEAKLVTLQAKLAELEAKSRAVLRAEAKNKESVPNYVYRYAKTTTLLHSLLFKRPRTCGGGNFLSTRTSAVVVLP